VKRAACWINGNFQVGIALPKHLLRTSPPPTPWRQAMRRRRRLGADETAGSASYPEVTERVVFADGRTAASPVVESAAPATSWWDQLVNETWASFGSTWSGLTSHLA
jgi:hypothetical protein